MGTRGTVFTRTLILLSVALGVAGFLIVRPVLATRVKAIAVNSVNDLIGISLSCFEARLASERTHRDLADVSVQMTITARARSSSGLIFGSKSSRVARFVSHHVVQPSASNIATSFDASARSVLA